MTKKLKPQSYLVALQIHTKPLWQRLLNPSSRMLMVMKSMWNTLLTSCGMKIGAEEVKTNLMNFVTPVLDQLSTQSASICALSLINPLLSAITVQGLITNRMIAGCFTQKGSTNCIEISSARNVMPTWLFLVMTCVRVVELDLLFELYYLPVWFRRVHLSVVARGAILSIFACL